MGNIPRIVSLLLHRAPEKQVYFFSPTYWNIPRLLVFCIFYDPSTKVHTVMFFQFSTYIDRYCYHLGPWRLTLILVNPPFLPQDSHLCNNNIKGQTKTPQYKTKARIQVCTYSHNPLGFYPQPDRFYLSIVKWGNLKFNNDPCKSSQLSQLVTHSAI